MAITLEEARKKYGVDELTSLKKALATLLNPETTKELREKGLLPKSMLGAWDLKAQHRIVLARELQPDVPMGETQNPDPERELESSSIIYDQLMEFNEDFNERMGALEADKEISEKTRKALADEMLKHINDIDKLGGELNQRKIDAMKDEGRLRFDKIVEKLEEKPLAGEHADRLVDHAKALYKLDPWRFLRIRDEIQDRSEEISALAEEGFEGGSEEELLRIEQLSDNIERMFKHDNVLDFLEKEREEAMRHWNIEPFPEAESAREKIIHKLQERKSELEKQGVEQEERRKHLEELRAKLNKEFIDELHPLLEKENKGFVFIDNEERQRVMKMPAHRIGEINEARPAIVFAGLPTRPKKEQYHYHL